jgi:hypothetical protein
MKNLHTKKGPFRERPYYSNQEIERICEDALRETNLYPPEPRAVRIERFVEKRFHITPSYEDLGHGILGLTKFGSHGVQAIIIARFLDDERSVVAERRIRTTLAHEAGHGLLHAHLFGLGCQEQSLFGDFSDPHSPKVLCRDIPTASTKGLSSYDGSWWEFQANRAIGALLLPRDLMMTAVDPFLSDPGLLGVRTLDSDRFDDAVASMSDLFEVNPAVARIRLKEAHPQNAQLLL